MAIKKTRSGARRRAIRMSADYSRKNDVTLKTEDCLEFLKAIPDSSAQLAITSPPYNVGKEYEDVQSLDDYCAFQSEVFKECLRIVRPGGSICWQVGTYVRDSNWVKPLDLALDPIFEKLGKPHDLRLRNRIIWHFGHGVHCQNRFSGRHEAILWYTKGDDYTYNLDDVRVLQKYPGKRHYKGAKRGEFSGNPRGKNPGDAWDIPNVKGNHIEKEDHPCQFPVEIPRRLILALTNPDDLVIDPFVGVGTTAVAAILTRRRVAGCDLYSDYVATARRRVRKAWLNDLRVRGDRPTFQPTGSQSILRIPDHFEIAAEPFAAKSY